MSKEMMRQQPFDGEHGSSSFSLTQSPTEPPLPIMQAIKPTDTTDMYNNLGSDGETGTS